MNFFPLEDRPDGNIWFDQDSKELFKKNIKTQPEEWRYRKINVTYRLNSFGYRTEEFNKIPWNKSIVIFGCSYIFGVGCALNETIAAQLSKLTKVPVINMGAPGSSPMFSLHNSSIMSAVYPKPLGVVFGWSAAQRCPLYLKDSVVHCGSWMEDISDLGKSWRRFDSNADMHLKMTRLTAQEMWSSKTKYFDFTLYSRNRSIIDCEYIKQIDYARDLAHAGVETNKLIAESIAESLNM